MEDKHWLIYIHEHNDWIHDCPKLVAVCNSADAAKLKQKELLDNWAKDVCIDDTDHIDIDYSAGIAKINAKSYFVAEIKIFNN